MEKKPYKSKSNYKSKDRGQRYSKRESVSRKEEAEMMDEAQTSQPAAGINFPSLTLVNAQHVLVGDSTDTAPMFVVTDVSMNPISSTANWDLILPLYDNYIRSYATARGYVSATAGTDIRDAILYSFEALSLLISLKRAQDAKNIRTQTGINIGRAFTDAYTSTSPNNVLTDTAPSVSVTNAASISNADWSVTYLSRIRNIILPQSMVQLALELYSVGYSMGAESALGNDSVIQLFHGGAVGLGATFTTVMNNLDALFVGHPDLKDIMASMGFVNDFVQAIDFSRDLNGETYRIVDNPEMIKALKNAYVFNQHAGATADPDVSRLFIEYSGSYSVFNYVTQTSTTPDAFLPIMVRLGGTSSFGNISKIVMTNGVYLNGTPGKEFFTLQPTALKSASAPTWTLADAILIQRRIDAALARFNLFFGNPLPYVVEATLNGSTLTNGTWTNITDVLNITIEGAATYVWNADEADVIRRVFFGILLHGVEWRQQLTALIQGQSKQSSNINY